MRIIPSVILAILILQICAIGQVGHGRSIGPDTQNEIALDMIVPIGSTIVIENRSIELKGPLIVNGTLILKNSSLTMDSSSDIKAEVNGLLRLMDLDNDPSTPDGSRFASNDTPILLQCNGGIDCLSSMMERLTVVGGALNITSSIVSNCTLRSGSYNITRSDISDMITDPDPSSIIIFSNVRGSISITGIPGASYEFGRLNIKGTQKNAIYLGQGRLTLRDCILRDMDTGILMGSGTSLELQRISVRAEQYNVRFMGSGGNVPTFNMTGCTFEHGINDMGWGTGNIRDCEFDGVMVEKILNGRIINSTFRNSNMAISEVRGTNITQNHFIEVFSGIHNMSFGKIYHNAFINVTEPFFNVFDSVQCYYQREGNYYSSYEGLDDGSGGRDAQDGKGDTKIPHLQKDLWPLMFDYYWFMPIVPTIDAFGGDGGPNITVRVLTRQEDRFIIQDSSSLDFKDDVRSFSTRGRTLIIPWCENGTHYLRARAYNSYGSRGWGGHIDITVDRWPLPPELVSITSPPEGHKVNVTWRYIGEDVHRVVISYIEGDKGQSIDIIYPTTTVTVKGLKNDRLYEFEIHSWDNSYRSRTSTVFYAMPKDVQPTGPPRGLQGEPMDNNSIAIRWIPPEVQDISHYQIMRSDDEGGAFSIVHETVDENVLTYIDKGLRDNRTYYYGVRAIDDDGPESEMAGPIAIRTKHVNNLPVYIGGEHTYYREEGDPPLKIEIYSSFEDPDGDKLEIEVSEADPFRSYIDHDKLIIVPEEDQNGQGHVQLMVDDGEERVFFLLWIIIAPSPDPPSIVEIIEPANNSILIPGGPVILSADIFDPDLPDDVLTVTWTSDRDGVVSRDISNQFTSEAYLSPGIHRLTLQVIDIGNRTDSRTINVAVSVWGFRAPLWNFTTDLEDSSITVGGFRFVSTVQNYAGTTLTFRCVILISGHGISDEYERVLVLSGGTDGSVIFQGRLPIRNGVMYNLTLTVRAETMDGTFAGERNATYRIIAEKEEKATVNDLLIVQISSVVLLFVIVVAGTFIMVRIRKNNKRMREIPQDRR